MEILEKPHVRRHRLTVDDYQRMTDAGVLAPDARVELIDGEIIDMAVIGSKHYWAVVLLGRMIQKAVGEEAIVAVQSPLQLGRANQPEPDLALLKSGTRMDALPSGTDTLLVIEVADSTLAYDQAIKAPLYARHGVPEYWIVDLQGECLQCFRRPQGDAWGDMQVIAMPARIALPGVDGAEIELGTIFQA